MKRNVITALFIGLTLSSTMAFGGQTCRLTDLNAAKERIHYDLDKMSPYALARYEETNSLEKIEKLGFGPFGGLNIGFVETMWELINADLVGCGFNPISRRNQSQAVLVSDIMALVEAKIEGATEAVFVRHNQQSVVISDTVVVSVD